jgi:hypothetical protein
MLRSVQHFAIVFAFAAAASAQNIHYADPAIGGTGGSGDASDPFHSIQQAVDAAASGDRIVVVSAAFVESVTILDRDLELEAPFGFHADWSPEGDEPALSLDGAAVVTLRRFSIASQSTPTGGSRALLEVPSTAELRFEAGSMEIVHDGWRWADVMGGALTVFDSSLSSTAETPGANGLLIQGGFASVFDSLLEVDSFTDGLGAPCSGLLVQSGGVLSLVGCFYEALGMQDLEAASAYAAPSIKLNDSGLISWNTTLTSFDGCGRLLMLSGGELTTAYSTLQLNSSNYNCLGAHKNCLLFSGASISLVETHFSGWYNAEFRAIGDIIGQGTIEGCSFTYSSSFDYGSPLHLRGPGLSVVDSYFGDLNLGSLGLGAVDAIDVEFVRCRFNNCFGAEEGALRIEGAGVVSGCEFMDCHTASDSYCHAGVGGGLRSESAVVVRDSVFARNRSGGPDCFLPKGGVGAAIHAPFATVEACTFVENESYVQPLFGGLPGPTVVAAELYNCLFMGEQPLASEAPTFVTYSLNSGQAGLGNLEGTPRFVDAVIGDYRLLPCSLGIDAGDPACVDEFGTVCEMGAFSFDPAAGAAAVQVCSGSPMAGCGAQLSVVGCASLGDDGIEVAVDQLAPGSWGVLLVGTPETAPAAYSSILCVGTPLLRYEPGLAQGSGACGGTRSFVLDEGLLGLLGVAAGDSLVLSYLSRAPGNPGALESSNGVLLGPLR